MTTYRVQTYRPQPNTGTYSGAKPYPSNTTREFTHEIAAMAEADAHRYAQDQVEAGTAYTASVELVQGCSCSEGANGRFYRDADCALHGRR